MEIVAKKYFKWEEPRAFLELRDAYEKAGMRWWSKPVAAVTGGSALMFHSFHGFNWGTPLESLGLTALIVLVGGLFMVYVMPAIAPHRPSKVIVYDKYILTERYGRQKKHKFADLKTFAWRERADFSTLILRSPDEKRVIMLGLPPELSTDEISQFLKERRLHPHGVPEPEEREEAAL
jgi:hypothetical protein